MATKKPRKKPPAKPKIGPPTLFPRPTAVLVKMDESDLDAIREAAERAGEKVSRWMRQRCVEAAKSNG